MNRRRLAFSLHLKTVWTIENQCWLTDENKRINSVHVSCLANGVARLSEYLSRLDSEDDEDEADEDENDEESNHFSSRSSRIRGFEGKVMDGSRLQYERESQMREVKNKSHPSRVQGDLVVEDLEELNRLFVDNREKKKAQTATELAKRKRARRVGNKKRSRTHRKPRLNHWEQMALDQSKQEVCGCRHHVKRLEADQVIYDWCRCKDHQHRDLKVKQKPAPPPPEIPKPPKAEKKSIGLDAMPPATTEVALSYDATDIDYDVIQEVLYYRTSSGRLVNPFSLLGCWRCSLISIEDQTWNIQFVSNEHTKNHQIQSHQESERTKSRSVLHDHSRAFWVIRRE